MRVRPFITVCSLVFAASHSAHAACALGDDLDPSSVADCPRFTWTQGAEGPYVQDRGEALWVDAQGVLHVAQKKEDVPEPYRSLYLAMRKQPDGSVAIVDDLPQFRSVSPAADFASPLATETARQRQEWRNTLLNWRAELYQSTRLLLQSLLHTAGDSLNPMAFAYAPGRQALNEQHAQDRADARERVLRARHMLLEELPEKARHQGVPPQWLQ